MTLVLRIMIAWAGLVAWSAWVMLSFIAGSEAKCDGETTDVHALPLFVNSVALDSLPHIPCQFLPRAGVAIIKSLRLFNGDVRIYGVMASE